MVTPSPKQHDGAVEDLSYRGFRGVRWKPGNQDHAGGRTYPAKRSARAPAVPAQSEAAHANMQKQNICSYLNWLLTAAEEP